MKKYKMVEQMYNFYIQAPEQQEVGEVVRNPFLVSD